MALVWNFSGDLLETRPTASTERSTDVASKSHSRQRSGAIVQNVMAITAEISPPGGSGGERKLRSPDRVRCQPHIIVRRRYPEWP
jgi:hypothetical protein